MVVCRVTLETERTANVFSVTLGFQGRSPWFTGGAGGCLNSTPPANELAKEKRGKQKKNGCWLLKSK
jgi:hypothetical protein